MKNNPIFIIAKKEIRDILRDYRLSIPTLTFAILLPTLILLGVRFIAFTYGELKNPSQSISLAMVFPISVLIVTFFPSALTVVIALESFVGEKERQTLENLLLAPVSDRDIYLGKLVASLSVPLSLGYFCFFLYFVECKLFLKYFVRTEVVILILLLVLSKSLLLVAGAIVLSCQAKTIRSANLNATLIVFPITFLIGVESHFLMHNKVTFLWIIFLGLVIYCLIFLRLGLKLFNRENLLLSDVHIFSVGDFFEDIKRKFIHAVIGENPTILDFLKDTLYLILKSKKNILLMTVFLIVGFFISYYYTLDLLPPDKINFCAEIVKTKNYDISDKFTPEIIARHNLRSVFVVSVLSIFTFGASALVFIFLPGAMVGGLTAFHTDGSLYCILHYLKFLLPHGILEIPAAILVATFIFNLGTFVFRVDKNNRPQDVFIKSLGELARIIIVAIPLFILASYLEVYW